MTYEAISNAARKLFKDTAAAMSDPPYVEYDNYPRTEAVAETLWMRFQVLPANSDVREMGGGKARTFGIALASIFAAPKTGDKVALETADSIVAAFKQVGYTFGGVTVTFRTPELSVFGLVGDWYQVNVSIPFWTDDA